MRAAIYARASTECQERQQTIDSQIPALPVWVEAGGHELNDHHVFRDEGYSGARLDRPGLDALRNAVRDGEVEVPGILAPDRLARNYAYQALLLEEFSSRPVNAGSPALCVLSWQHHAACRTRARSSLKPARPYTVRLSILSRLIWPSAGLVVQGRSRAACTAAISRRNPAANSAKDVLDAASSTWSRLSWLSRRNSRFNRFAIAIASASPDASCSRWAMKACSTSES